MSDEDDQIVDHREATERFFDDLWNDAEMSFADDAERTGALISEAYRPGYWRTLHHGWRTAPDRSGHQWLTDQIGAYRDEYPDFEMHIRGLIVDGPTVVSELTFSGGHATEVFTDRGGAERPVTRTAQGIGWTRFGDDGIVRHGFFWEGGNFLGRDR